MKGNIIYMAKKISVVRFNFEISVLQTVISHNEQLFSANLRIYQRYKRSLSNKRNLRKARKHKIIKRSLNDKKYNSRFIINDLAKKFIKRGRLKKINKNRKRINKSSANKKRNRPVKVRISVHLAVHNQTNKYDHRFPSPVLLDRRFNYNINIL